MRDSKEILSFISHSPQLMSIKLIKEKKRHLIIVDDMKRNAKDKKVHETTSLQESLTYFHKLVKLFTDKIK